MLHNINVLLNEPEAFTGKGERKKKHGEKLYFLMLSSRRYEFHTHI